MFRISWIRQHGLVAPWNRLPGVQWVSYIEQMLPELVWIAVAMEVTTGAKTGVFQELEKLYKEVEGVEGKTENLAWTSSWRELNHEQAEVARAVARELMAVRKAAETMCRIYPNCPLTVIVGEEGGHQGTEEQKIDDWNKIAQATLKAMNKHRWEGVALHGALYHYRTTAGKVVMHPDVEGPLYANAALEDPESDDGRKGAGFLRAFAMTEAAILSKDVAWSKTFWNENMRRTQCTT